MKGWQRHQDLRISLRESFSPRWILLLLVMGSALSWGAVHRADRFLRESFLQQAHAVAGALSAPSIRNLSGTSNDLSSSAYQALKEQLQNIRQFQSAARFFYLMGRREDGTIFFFLDSEPPTSPAYSPPGFPYEEASAGCHRAFLRGIATVEGPVTDRWGRWVTALVPLLDSRHRVTAVLGVDMDASAWRWAIMDRAAGMLGVIWVLCMVVFGALVIFRQREHLRESEARNEVLVEQSPLGIVLLNLERAVVYANPAFEKMLDVAPGELLGRPYMDLVHPDDREGSLHRLFRNQTPKAPLPLREHRLCSPRGHQVEVESTVRNGEALIMIVFQDITERKIAEAALRESEKHFLDVMHGSEDAIFFLSENTILDCNDAALRLFGQKSREEMLRAFPWRELSPPVQPDGRSSPQKAAEMVLGALQQGFRHFSWVHRRAGGEDFPAEVGLTVVLYQGQRMLFATVKDITERRKIENEVHSKSLALDQIDDAVTMTDLEGHVTYANRAQKRFWQKFGEEALGEATADRRAPLLPPFRQEMLRKGDQAGSWRGEISVVGRDGGEYTLDCRTQVILDHAENPVALCHIATDITARKQAEQTIMEANCRLLAMQEILEQEATHDHLTGALNRRAILGHLTQELENSHCQERAVAVAVCDIDHFKNVNDTYGHQVGDDVLQGFVQLLQQHLTSRDRLGRLGGEEFLLVLSAPETQDGDFLRDLVQTVGKTGIPSRAGLVFVTMSLGVVRIKELTDTDSALGAADRALYRAKAKGRHRVCFAEATAEDEEAPGLEGA